MAGLKEIKRRLRSVRNTKKITYAMKLVSAAKLRKAQESVQRSRHYTEALKGLVATLSGSLNDGEALPLLRKAVDGPRKIRLLILGGSRGLCGGFNTNLNKLAEASIRELSKQHPGVAFDFVLVGRKPVEYFNRTGRVAVAAFDQVSEDANLWPIEAIAQRIEDDFCSGQVDEVHILYTKFRSAISVLPTREKLLPLDPEALTSGATSEASGAPVLFEPAPAELFAALLPRIMRSRIRQAALDAKASEQGSRMTAMDNATKNASDLSFALQLKANKLRQSGITAQLLDIIGGAEAIS